MTLAPRLFDTLLYLVANHDRLVEKTELLAAVWGRRAVEDANLSQAIFALRRVLQTEGTDDAFIVTVPGRGYRVGVPVVFEAAPSEHYASSPGTLLEAQAAPIAAAAAPLPAGPGLFRASLASLALAAAGLLAWHFVAVTRPTPPASQPFAPPPHSIAIMAFTNMSGDASQDYMSDGISEEVIDALDRVGRLRVAARLSSFAFKGRQNSVEDIARQLNVGAVLEGSVRRDGTRLRIVAQLIDATTGFQLWSRHYDRAWGDVLAVQEDIAQAVASSLKVTLLDDDVAKLRLGGTTNAKAMDAYLRGEQRMHSLDRRAFPAALADFNEAVTADPDFALAYCSGAIAEATIAFDMGSANSATVQQMRARALASAKRAIALSPRLAEAHAALAAVLEGSFLDPAGAVVEASRAVALEPNNLRGQYQLAQALMETGRLTESIAVAERAAAAEPLSTTGWDVYAYVLMNAHRYDKAVDALGHIKAISGVLPPMAVTTLTEVELMTGDAKNAAANCLSGATGLGQNMCLAIAYHALGRQDEAHAQLAAVQAAANYTPYVGAVIFAQWGETDHALDALQAAYDARDARLDEMTVDPFLDPIRHTPRFAEIARRLNF